MVSCKQAVAPGHRSLVTPRCRCLNPCVILVTMRTFMITCLAVASLCVCVAQARTETPVFSPNLLGDKTYSESWTTVAVLPDETIVHAGLLISNAGLSSGKASCTAKVLDRAGKRWSGEILVDRDGWSFNPAYGLKVGACSLEQHDNETVLHMPFKDGTIKITYRDAPHATPMPEMVHANDRFYDSQILIPFAKVTVLHPVPDAAPRSQAGFAFLDHTRSTTLPGDVGYGWMRFRGFAPECSRLVLTRFISPAKGKDKPKVQSVWWKEGESAPKAIKSPSMMLPPTDISADNLRATMYDGSERLFSLQGKRRLWRDAPFKEHGLMGRLVGAFVGDVVLEAFVATLEEPGDGPCKKVTGLLELDHFGG